MDNLKEWLESLNPEEDWDMDHMDVLEEQVVNTVKESGYINLPLLLKLIKDDINKEGRS